MIFSAKRIEEMSREQLNNLVNVSDVESGSKRTLAVTKARQAAYQRDHQSTGKADNDAVNAVLRAIRRDGPMETRKVAIAMAAVESATYAEIASDALTDAEYTTLVRPLARAIGEPEKRPRPARQVVLEPGEPVTEVSTLSGEPEPSEEELEAFFGTTPDPQLVHGWEQAIKGAPDQYPVPQGMKVVEGPVVVLDGPDAGKQILPRAAQLVPVEEEEFDLFS